MPRWLVIALTLVLFTFAMTAWGWVVGVSVPPLVDAAVDRIGHAGFWLVFGGLMLALAVYAYRGHRKPNGT